MGHLFNTLFTMNKELQQQFKSLNTPFYYYDMEHLNKTLDTAKGEADKYGFHLHYAVKANFNAPILNLIAGKGFGADCVSGREVEVAVKNGFKSSDIVFA